MKILCVANNYNRVEKGEIETTTPIIFTKPDSAILKKNKPFFLPDFCKEICLTLSPVLIITRLGKTIAERFAYRYYSEITVGIDIHSGDMLNSLSANGLSWDLATGFDGSSPLGTFIPTADIPDIKDIDFRLDINGNTVQQYNIKDLTFSSDTIVSYLSRYFTLKTGDLIFISGSKSVQPFSIDCSTPHTSSIDIKAYLNNNLLLDFPIV